MRPKIKKFDTQLSAKASGCYIASSMCSQASYPWDNCSQDKRTIYPRVCVLKKPSSQVIMWDY